MSETAKKQTPSTLPVNQEVLENKYVLKEEYEDLKKEHKDLLEKMKIERDVTYAILKKTYDSLGDMTLHLEETNYGITTHTIKIIREELRIRLFLVRDSIDKDRLEEIMRVYKNV